MTRCRRVIMSIRSGNPVQRGSEAAQKIIYKLWMAGLGKPNRPLRGRSEYESTMEGKQVQVRVEDLEQRLRQLTLLQEAVKKVNSILDLEQLLDEIVGSVAENFGCNRTAVLLWDETTDELEMIALRGFADVHLKGYRFKVGAEGMVGHVGATREVRYAPDVRK